jgi:hypothetical protein
MGYPNGSMIVNNLRHGVLSAQSFAHFTAMLGVSSSEDEFPEVLSFTHPRDFHPFSYNDPVT